MFENLHCIALRTVRHSDSKNLLSAWSREAGRITLSMPAGGGREARRRAGLTVPLALFEGQVDIKPGRDIHSMRDLKPMEGSPALESSPIKGLTGMFLAEFLDLLLRRSEPEEGLSDYLFTSVEMLSALTDAAAVANFHLVFLYGLTRHAGIEPRYESEGPIFDLRDGCFRPVRPLHPDWLDEEVSEVIRRLAHVQYIDAGGLCSDRGLRRRVLDALLNYYSIHLLPLTSLKSPDILSSLSNF